jgi:hypothetical protein
VPFCTDPVAKAQLLSKTAQTRGRGRVTMGHDYRLPAVSHPGTDDHRRRTEGRRGVAVHEMRPQMGCRPAGDRRGVRRLRENPPITLQRCQLNRRDCSQVNIAVSMMGVHWKGTAFLSPDVPA